MKVKVIVLLGVIIFIALIVSLYFYSRHEEETKKNNVVKILDGSVKGRNRFSIVRQKSYYSFQGIPYAKPPVGPLRFKEPLPIDKWDGILDATKEGDTCRENENCLFINVFTSQLPVGDTPHLEPVMVYIHGGGFVSGSSKEDCLGPDFIIEKDVVLATFNYRLGVFGFLSLENDDVPGNAGMKDQVLALKWVTKNIHHFGGDPNNITIFGESAGSASVQLQTLSPMSEGLFHRAILQSGVAINPWVLQKDPIERAFLMGKQLGTNTTRTDELVNFLKNASMSDLDKTQWGIRTKMSDGKCVEFPFTPTIEKNTSGTNFILEDPKVLMKSGRFHKVPMIIGMVDQEGSLILEGLKDIRSAINNFDGFVPRDLKLKTDSQEFKDLEEKIKALYFHNKTINGNDSLIEFVDMCGDFEFVIGIHQTINYILTNSNVPLYVYQFSFDGKFGNSKQDIKRMWGNTTGTIPSGTYHSDDNGYVFHQQPQISYDTSSTDYRMAQDITHMWTNFAINGNPSIPNNTWKASTKDQPQYMSINMPSQLINSNLSPARTSFWDDIYNKYG